MPLWKLGKFLHTPGRIEQVKRSHVYTTLARCRRASGVRPVSCHCRTVSRAPWRSGPKTRQSVYVDVPGSRLEEVYVRAGDRVQAGDRLARLSNLELDLVVAQLSGQRNENEKMLRYLSYARTRDPQAAEEYQEVRETLEAVGKQLHRKQDDEQRLLLKCADCRHGASAGGSAGNPHERRQVAFVVRAVVG